MIQSHVRSSKSLNNDWLFVSHNGRIEMIIDTQSVPGAWEEHYQMMQKLHQWNKQKADDEQAEERS